MHHNQFHIKKIIVRNSRRNFVSINVIILIIKLPNLFLFSYILNEEDFNQLIVINERLYQVFSVEEKNEIIDHELYKTGEKWIYLMYKLGFYDVESDIIMNVSFFAKLYLFMTLFIIGLIILNEAKFILWNFFDMFRTRPAVIQRYKLNKTK